MLFTLFFYSYFCKMKYQNSKLKDVSTQDLLDRIEFYHEQHVIIQNIYGYMYREWCNEVAYRLYA